MIVASLASIPTREASLKKTVASLLPQVDRINVYLNGWSKAPAFLGGITDVRKSQDTPEGDIGDAGKFFWSGQLDDDYHFTCDDDLKYPPDYVEKLKAAIDHHERKAVVGIHGCILRQPISTYRKSRRLFHCLRTVSNDHWVHVLGTGAMAYHTSTIRLSVGAFLQPNMADVWFAMEAQRKKVPLLCLKHSGTWLKPLLPKSADTLWKRRRGRGGDVRETRAVKTISWRLHSGVS